MQFSHRLHHADSPSALKTACSRFQRRPRRNLSVDSCLGRVNVMVLIALNASYALAYWFVICTVACQFPKLDSLFVYAVSIVLYAMYFILHIRDLLNVIAYRRLWHRARGRVTKQINEMLKHGREFDRADIVLREIDHEIDCLERELRNHDGSNVQLEIGELERMMRSLHGRYCEHPVVDALLCCKAAWCVQSNVDCHLDCQVPAAVGLNGVELCSVFGNILDNAVHACMRLRVESYRWIHLQARVQYGCLQVICRNTYSSEERIPTCKTVGDSLNREHGWGLSILQQIVDSHQGLISYGTMSGACSESDMVNEAIGIEVWEIRIVVPFLDDDEEMP